MNANLSALPAVALAATLIAPALAASQETIPYPRRDRLTTQVVAVGTLLQGDTIQVVYTLYNNSTSIQPAMFFAISTPSTLTAKVGGPIGQTWYSLTGKRQDSLVIAWSVPDEPYLIQPGDSAVGFFHSAVGEPNITRYYVQGDILIPEETDSAGNPYGNALPIWRDSYKGWTIAVVPLMNMAAPNMAERLVVVTSRACGDPAFITSPTLCENPNSRPRRAEQAIVENNLRGACDHLEALITEVAALSDAVITPEGRSLLTIRALQFIRRHCTQ